MKKLIFLIAYFLFIITQSYSQENYPLGMGLFLSLKSGVNGVASPAGRKNKIAFNGLPDFGITSYVPVGVETKLAFTFDLAYSTYAYSVISNDYQNRFTLRYSYLAFSPNIHFDGVIFGFNFGYPIAASYGATIDRKNLSLLAECRLGGIIPVYTDEKGRLNIVVLGGYMLTGIYKDFTKDDPLILSIPPEPYNLWTKAYNPRALSLSVGVNYTFNLEPPAEAKP
ncbi:MAG: hypothetical protein ABSG15_11365 [FCB group bacterium]|jgi:hypothetical protein